MINVRIPHKEVQRLSPKISVLGVGGAGGNAVNNMITSGLQGCEFIVCNTDAQALESSLSENKIQLGVTVTGGLGAGARPEVGHSAAEESLDEVMQHLEGSNMAFITAGMGGGTGTGAAPVIAKACREMGVLTVGVVTKPFHFEGAHRMKMAESGIDEMQDYVDTLIVIPNQNLFRIANEKTTFAEAFKMADSVLQSGVRGVTDLMVMPGLINLDFADIRSAMLEMGKAMMGTGEAEGDRRAVESAEAAINNPLLDDVSMKGARGVIINVTGGFDMTLFEVDEACNRIRDEVDPDANIIFGSTFDEKLDGVMRVSVVATGIEAESQRQHRPSGNISINSITGQQQQERKIDRAQPNTERASGSENKPAEPVAQPKTGQPVSGVRANVPSQGPMTASAMSYAAAIAATKRQDEPEAEMFEQQTFDTASAQSQNAGPQSGQPQVLSQSPAGAPRGTVYNESFIPPRPMEPEPARAETEFRPQQQTQQSQQGQGQQQQPQQQQQQQDMSRSLTANRQAQQEQPVQTQARTTGLALKPPVPGGGGPKKKTPSLFERFTNPFASHTYRDEEEQQGETGSGSSGGYIPPTLRAPQREEPQGSLNIDAPQSGESEDELDIPAFLRRQAN